MSIICYVDIKEEKRFSDYLKEKENEGYTIYHFKNCKESLDEIVSLTEQVNLFVSNKLFVLEDDLGIEALHFNGGADIALLLVQVFINNTLVFAQVFVLSIFIKYTNKCLL